MGLDVSHDAWSGPYSRFHRWRKHLAKAAGLPPLELMEGFYTSLSFDGDSRFMSPTFILEAKSRLIVDLDSYLPIKWECLAESPLHELLNHSDCSGEIAHENCLSIAIALESIINNINDEWVDTTKKFIDGLKLAHESKENIEFF